MNKREAKRLACHLASRIVEDDWCNMDLGQWAEGEDDVERLEEAFDELVRELRRRGDSSAAPSVGDAMSDGPTVHRHHGDEGGVDRSTEKNSRAFTDLNRWLAKVMAIEASAVDLPMREAFREDPDNPSDLHRVAGVSQAKAYQFARTLRDLGLLEWGGGTFRVPDRRRLIDRMYDSERQLSFDRIPVRRIVPTSYDPVDELCRMEAIMGGGVDWAVGGFAAADVYGILHVAGPRVPIVHVFGRPDDFKGEYDLERCDDRDAELSLVRGPYSESIERGVVEQDGVLVVDAVQVVLDCARRPDRGLEQAQYIVDHVLEW